MTPTGPLQVTLSGLLRGRELTGEATAVLEAEALVLTGASGRLVVPLTGLDGVRMLGSALELYLVTGDVVQLERAPELGSLASELARRACAIPELTRSLRAFGSRRAANVNEHDRFFDIFLSARRAAESAPNLVAVRAAFDTLALRAGVARQLHEIAAERYPNDPPERRALEAELEELVQPLEASFGALEGAERALGSCEDGERFARWREWSSALRSVFERADATWLAIQPVLSTDRRARRSGWRRWLPFGALLLAVALGAGALA